ncbi:MAG TPA: NAD(P)/FAD-dependent oxidoreductase [Verrucomicrobiota bacterium]|nr:NAD(P)/FAD-dependent oxidoreductase [Verrucomicrobiota bacterium]HNT14856.1 NAD(P)/FAD-dependent oxidoreductase [Verrucomicrobiota bacterium]
MGEKSILIIGAGVAGLATGCFGRMNGYRTRILEHHSEAGGVAKAWRNKDYLIDGGVHYLMGHRPGSACYDLYRELGILNGRAYPDLLNYCDFTDEATGQRISFTDDLAQLARDLDRLAPEDAAATADFIRGIRAFQRIDMFALMQTPLELMGWRGAARQAWRLRGVWRYLGGAYNRPTREFCRRFKNPVLRRVMQHLFLPEMPMWFVLLILSLLANRQMGLLARSCQDFVESLSERYLGLGGELTCNATVAEILVENHRAVGVRLANGETHRADVVVAAGDGTNTLFKLLGGKYVGPTIRKRYATWPQLKPVVTLSLGVRRDFTNETPLRFLLLRETLTIGHQTIDGFPIRIFNYGAGFAPAGRTVFQVLLLTDWKFWNDLIQDRARYQAEKERVSKEILARLEPHYPGITGQVELVDMATPHTTWRFTLNNEGAFMGWSPTPVALRTPFKKTLPGLANFYMAGQWVMPGGGIPPCLYSGRHVIQLLCRADGKKFVTSTA